MALRSQPYIPLYVLDFLSDEKLRECSAESAGVYIMLMCVMHRSEVYGAITLRDKYKLDKDDTDTTAFANMLQRQLPYEPEVIKRSLDDLIDNGVLTKDGDTIYQKRMVRDAELSATRTVAGARGGRKNGTKVEPDTEAKTKQAQESKTQAKVSETEKAKSKQIVASKIEANTEIENEVANENESANEDIDKNESTTSESIMDRRFDIFWDAYPKKTGKGYARKAFRKIAPNEELFQKILSAIERGKKCEQWQKDRGEFIPNPATWLNQERWEDDYDETWRHTPDTGQRRTPQRTTQDGFLEALNETFGGGEYQ